MAIKSYVKKPITIHSKPLHKKEIFIKPDLPRRRVTVWGFMSSTYNDILDYLTISKISGLLIPLVLIMAGFSILFDQLWPEFEQIVKEKEGYLDQGTTSLVEGDYVEERQLFLSNPGAKYFKDLTDNSQNALKVDDISNNFRGSFKISIPSLNLENLPVEANVDSGNEDIYKSVLERSLAHFKGTSLPVSDVNNNSVIYGHSANGNYYERTQDPAGAFSRLQDIKIGERITLEIQGKKYEYKVSRTKIVNPDDISIITGTQNRKTLTLFTCFPKGNPDKRFVVVANPV